MPRTTKPPADSISERTAKFEALAQKYRDLAAFAIDAQLIDGYAKLADGYEALAKGFERLRQK